MFLLVGNFFIASNVVMGQSMAAICPPWILTLCRSSIALLILLLFFISTIHHHRYHLWKHRWPLLFQGLTGITICGGFGFEAVRTTSATNAGFIFAFAPMITLILAHFWLKEPIFKRQIVGIIIALIGVLIIIAKGSLKELLAMGFSVGDWWMLGNTFSYALFTVLVKRYRSEISPFATLAAVMFFGAFFSFFPAMSEIFLGDLPTISPAFFIGILYAGIFTAVIAFFFVIRGTEIAGAKTAGILLNVLPLFIAIQAFFVLGDNLYWYHLIAVIIIAIGILLTTINGHIHTQATEHDN